MARKIDIESANHSEDDNKKAPSGKFATMSIRTTILVALLLQNSGYTLFRKYSTMTEDVSSREILLVGELIKFVFSTYGMLNYVTTYVTIMLCVYHSL